jgi:3-phosphoshikimate 1-carboxyvinyltransferase
MMGAIIDAKHETRNTKHEEYPPITIRGGKLKPITYKMPVASAQVKSAILLAGLYAEGRTQAIESAKTRDHTERMLKLFKADIKLKQNKIVIKGNQELVSPGRINIPGDISSAAFFLVSAAIIPGSKILIKNVSLNPWRMGLIKVLKRMGAKIRVTSYQLPVTGYEPAGDILIRSSKLKGTTVGKEEIPSLIDELPILMVAASLAKGKTVLEGVGELRVKETDRIESMAENLMEMGAYIQIERAQGTENIIIEGVKNLKGNRVRSFGDHRTAMSMIVAGLKAEGKTLIDDITCISKSFPQFLALLEPLIK